MAATNVPARTPEPQPSHDENTAQRPATWPREKKTRFAIKVGGVIPC
jgi:hypothetical protein